MINNTASARLEARIKIEAEWLCEKYKIPCAAVLARAMRYMYLCPDGPPGPEYGDWGRVDHKALVEFHSAFTEAKASIKRVLSTKNLSAHYGLPYIIDTLDPKSVAEVKSALILINTLSNVRSAPADSHTAYLPWWIDDISEYIMFITGKGPVYFNALSSGPSTWARQFAADVLKLTGWSYSEGKIDAACREAQNRLQAKRPKHCESNADRAEAKAWRDEANLASTIDISGKPIEETIHRLRATYLWVALEVVTLEMAS